MLPVRPREWNKQMGRLRNRKGQFRKPYTPENVFKVAAMRAFKSPTFMRSAMLATFLLAAAGFNKDHKRATGVDLFANAVAAFKHEAANILYPMSAAKEQALANTPAMGTPLSATEKQKPETAHAAETSKAALAIKASAYPSSKDAQEAKKKADFLYATRGVKFGL